MTTRTKTLLSSSAVLGIAVAMFFILSPRAGTDSAEQAQARASVLVPDITLITASTSGSLLPVSTSTAIAPGNTLVTSHTGRGIVEEENGTATLLDYDTTFTVLENGGKGTRVRGRLSVGAMWARVEKLFGKGEYYEIKTQNALAVVRGTSFGVSYRNHLTTLEVSGGTVGFVPVATSTGEVEWDKEVLVSAGQGAIADDSGVISVFSLTAADRRESWFLFNNPATTTLGAVVDTVTNTVGATVTNVVNTVTTVGPVTVSTVPVALTVTAVTPAAVVQGQTTRLVGTGFLHVNQINYGGTMLPRSEFTAESDTSIVIKTATIPPGTYDIRVTDATDATVNLRLALTVTAPVRAINTLLR